MKRALQITMLVTAAIPLVLGIVNLIFGAQRFVAANEVTANLDSQLRFYAVWFAGLFFLTLWCVRNLEIAGPVMRIMFITMAIGGVARIYSLGTVGIPDVPMIGAIVIEIAVLAFIPWHAAYMRSEGHLHAVELKTTG